MDIPLRSQFCRGSSLRTRQMLGYSREHIGCHRLRTVKRNHCTWRKIKKKISFDLIYPCITIGIACIFLIDGKTGSIGVFVASTLKGQSPRTSEYEELHRPLNSLKLCDRPGIYSRSPHGRWRNSIFEYIPTPLSRCFSPLLRND